MAVNELKHVQCIAIDADTIRSGGSFFKRVVTCNKCVFNDGGVCSKRSTIGCFKVSDDDFCSWGESK